LRELACLLQSQQQESMTGETDEEATCVEETGAQQEDAQEPVQAEGNRGSLPGNQDGFLLL
jgi:hypothetical protein